MKIKLFQQGGGFASSTFITPAAPVDSTAVSETKSTKSQESVLEDEMFKELITKGGLINDVNSFARDIYRLESSSNTPFSTQSNITKFMRLLPQLNQVKQNNDLWKDAVKRATDAGGYGEVAVGTSGEVYAKNEDGEITPISIDAFNISKGNYKLLTVAELMYERQMNPQLAFQNGVFNVADNAVGIDKIKDEIKGTIAALGKEDISETSVHTKEWARDQKLSILQSLSGKVPTPDEQNAIDSLQRAIDSPDTQVNLTKKTSSERNHLDKALNYIWKTLGANKQQKLKAVAAINGVKNPTDLIWDMLVSQTDYGTTTDISTSTPKGELASKTTSKENSFGLLHSGKVGRQEIMWNDPLSNKTYQLQATGSGVLTNPNGTSIGTETWDRILNGVTGQVVDTNAVYFGNKKATPDDLQKMVYNNTEAARVYMPVDSDGAPDYAGLQQIQALEKEVNKHPEWSAQRINDFWKDHGKEYIKVNDNKVYIENSRFKPFLLATAYTTDEAAVSKGNSKIRALSGEEEDEMKETMDATWKKNNISAPTGRLWTTYYKGSVAIPYRPYSSYYAAATTGLTSDKLTGMKVNEQISKGNTNVKADIDSLK